MGKNGFLFATTATLAVAVLPRPGLADEEAADRPAGNSLQEIVVTAQKREQKAQDVPIALTAFNTESLEKIGFTNLTDLQQKVPALVIEPYMYASSAPTVFMRGVGDITSYEVTTDSGVGMYLDDIYLGRSQGLVSQLGDLDRVEVLRGPQGTLYGRNTIGGAVKFVTAKPTGEFGLKQTLDFGNFGYSRTLTSVNLPQVAGFSVKLNYLSSGTDGYIKNSGSAGDFGKQDQKGYRAQVRWRPADALTVDYAYDHSSQDATGVYIQPIGGSGLTRYAAFAGLNSPLFPDYLDHSWRPVDFPERDNYSTGGHSLVFDWNASDLLTLKSITAYRTLDSDSSKDTVEAFTYPFAVVSANSQHQLSQELLLSGQTASHAIKYTLGLYYFREKGAERGAAVGPAGLAVHPTDPYYAWRPPTMADLGPYSGTEAENKSSAAYGQLSWVPPVLDDRLTVDMGLRYTRDSRREHLRNIPQHIDGFGVKTYSHVDESLTFDYRWEKSLHTYLKYSTGYKSGGFTSADLSITSFLPEILKSYEAGLKSELWDRRLRLNAALFYTHFTDVQLPVWDPTVLKTKTINASERDTKGVEVDAEIAPLDGLVLSVNYAYLSVYQPPLTNPFVLPPSPPVVLSLGVPQAPKHKVSASVDYTFAPFSFGTLSLWGHYSYTTRELSVSTLETYRPAYGVGDARMTLSDIPGVNNLSTSLWVNNLTDRKYAIYQAFGGRLYGQPRTYGVNLIYKF